MHHIKAAAAAAAARHSVTSSILLLTAPVNTPRSPELFIHINSRQNWENGKKKKDALADTEFMYAGGCGRCLH